MIMHFKDKLPNKIQMIILRANKFKGFNSKL